MKYIPYGCQWIDESDIQAVVETLKSDFLTQGPKIPEFEKALADYAGVPYAVVFNSGTAALHAAMFAIGLKKGDEAITTPNTFCATSNSVLYQNAKPVFCDINLGTYNIDETKIKSCVTSKTKAIIPVLFAGRPCDMDEILKIKKEFGLYVIEDACHALGAQYKGKKIGSIADISCFSFHPVKHVATGEGGAALTHSREFYEKMLQFRTHGITRQPELLKKNYGPWYYEMQFLGYNYRLTDIQAALGISQLKKIDKFIERRGVIARRYFEAFKDVEQIILPQESLPHGSVHAYHLFVIRVKNDRKDVFLKLRDKNLGVNVHYIPVYSQPFYKKKGFGKYKKSCPCMEKYYESCLSLPIYPKMTDEDVEYVIKSVKESV